MSPPPALQPAPLGAFFDAALAEPSLRAMLRKLLGVVPERVQVGLPRVARTHGRDPAAVDVICTRHPCDPSSSLRVRLPIDRAAMLVDRVLGGHGQGAVAARAAMLSDAEQGVLAYAAARLLAELSTAWCVRDVAPAREQDTTLGSFDIIWPVRIDGSWPLDAELVLSDRAARELVPAVELELCIADRCTREELDGLDAGDVLVSDALPLTSTVEGAAGPVLLRVRGVGEVQALLSGREARARAQRTHEMTEPRLVMVLAQRTLDLAQLAHVLDGSEPAFREVVLSEAQLEHAGRVVGFGDVVTLRGAPAVRVTRCESAASPEPQRG